MEQVHEEQGTTGEARPAGAVTVSSMDGALSISVDERSAETAGLPFPTPRRTESVWCLVDGIVVALVALVDGSFEASFREPGLIMSRGGGRERIDRPLVALYRLGVMLREHRASRAAESVPGKVDHVAAAPPAAPIRTFRGRLTDILDPNPERAELSDAELLERVGELVNEVEVSSDRLAAIRLAIPEEWRRDAEGKALPTTDVLGLMARELDRLAGSQRRAGAALARIAAAVPSAYKDPHRGEKHVLAKAISAMAAELEAIRKAVPVADVEDAERWREMCRRTDGHVLAHAVEHIVGERDGVRKALPADPDLVARGVLGAVEQLAWKWEQQLTYVALYPALLRAWPGMNEMQRNSIRDLVGVKASDPVRQERAQDEAWKRLHAAAESLLFPDATEPVSIDELVAEAQRRGKVQKTWTLPANIGVGERVSAAINAFIDGLVNAAPDRVPTPEEVTAWLMARGMWTGGGASAIGVSAAPVDRVTSGEEAPPRKVRDLGLGMLFSAHDLAFDGFRAAVEKREAADKAYAALRAAAHALVKAVRDVGVEDEHLATELDAIREDFAARRPPFLAWRKELEGRLDRLMEAVASAKAVAAPVFDVNTTIDGEALGAATLDAQLGPKVTLRWSYTPHHDYVLPGRLKANNDGYVFTPDQHTDANVKELARPSDERRRIEVKDSRLVLQRDLVLRQSGVEWRGGVAVFHLAPWADEAAPGHTVMVATNGGRMQTFAADDHPGIAGAFADGLAKDGGTVTVGGDDVVPATTIKLTIAGRACELTETPAGSWDGRTVDDGPLTSVVNLPDQEAAEATLRRAIGRHEARRGVETLSPEAALKIQAVAEEGHARRAAFHAAVAQLVRSAIAHHSRGFPAAIEALAHATEGPLVAQREALTKQALESIRIGISVRGSTVADVEEDMKLLADHGLIPAWEGRTAIDPAAALARVTFRNLTMEWVRENRCVGNVKTPIERAMRDALNSIFGEDLWGVADFTPEVAVLRHLAVMSEWVLRTGEARIELVDFAATVRLVVEVAKRAVNAAVLKLHGIDSPARVDDLPCPAEGRAITLRGTPVPITGPVGGGATPANDGAAPAA